MEGGTERGKALKEAHSVPLDGEGELLAAKGDTHLGVFHHIPRTRHPALDSLRGWKEFEILLKGVKEVLTEYNRLHTLSVPQEAGTTGKRKAVMWVTNVKRPPSQEGS